MSVDKFFLQMKSHSKQVFSVLRELYDSASLTDVTLLCEGHYFGAHRLVLSACSPYFRTLFMTIPDKHPVIFMKGVKKSEMIDILDFMYNGEVTISHTQLASFLQIADELSVNGLTKGLQNEYCGEDTTIIEHSLEQQNDKKRHLSQAESIEDNKRKITHIAEDTDDEPSQQELNEILPHLDLNNTGDSIEVLIDKETKEGYTNVKITCANHKVKENDELMLGNLEINRDQQGFSKSRAIETDIKEEIESPDNTSQGKREISRACVPSVDVLLNRQAMIASKAHSNTDLRQETTNTRAFSHWTLEPGDGGISGTVPQPPRGVAAGGGPLFAGTVCAPVGGSGAGAYQCPVCGKMCNAKHHLTYHLRTHTGERPYRCDVCGLTFSQQSNMYRHKRTKHVGVSNENRALVEGQGFAMVDVD